MHSSGMRTTRFLTVSQHALWWGVYLPRGMYLLPARGVPAGGGVPAESVPDQGGTCQGGVPARGVFKLEGV